MASNSPAGGPGENTPPAWHAGLAPEELAHATTKGWDKLDAGLAAAAAAKAHFGVEKFMGVPPENVIVAPKDVNDPGYQSAYDRIVGLGAPKDAAEYKFDGLTIGDKDAEFVRNLAFTNKLSAPQARNLAAEFLRHAAAGTANDEQQVEITKGANNVALRQHWNTDYDMKNFAVSKVAEALGLPPEVVASFSTLPTPAHVKTMDALFSLSNQLNEAVMLRGGVQPRDPTAGMSPDQAQARYNTLKEDKGWVTRYLANDAAAVAEFTKLHEIMYPPRR